MNEIEFARAHLGDYRVQGAEIKPRLCPYCRMEIARDATRCPHCTSELK